MGETSESWSGENRPAETPGKAKSSGMGPRDTGEITTKNAGENGGVKGSCGHYGSSLEKQIPELPPAKQVVVKREKLNGGGKGSYSHYGRLLEEQISELPPAKQVEVKLEKINEASNRGTGNKN